MSTDIVKYQGTLQRKLPTGALSTIAVGEERCDPVHCIGTIQSHIHEGNFPAGGWILHIEKIVYKRQES